MQKLLEQSRVPQVTFIATFCKTQTFEDREVTTECITADEVESYTDEYGCSYEMDNVLALSIGETLTIGFPQGSYFGLIITRIA